MSGFRALSPNINVNTESGQLRTELQNTFARLDGELQLAPYRVAVGTGPVGNVTTSETDLVTYTVTYDVLSKTNSSLLIFASGKTAANANNKTLKLVLGSTTLFTSGALASNNIDWTLQAEILRVGAASQIVWAQFLRNGSSPIVTTTTTAVDMSVNNTLKLTGTGTASSDISYYSWKILLLT